MTSTSLPAQVARTQRFTVGAPDHFTVVRGGLAVLFLRSRNDNSSRCLWVLDVATRTERLLADPDDLSADTELGSGIDAYAVDSAGQLVAFALAGRLWTVAVEGGRPRQLPAQAPVIDPRPDAAGERIAYVCRGALRVISGTGVEDRVLAAPDGPEVTYGLAELTGATSMDGPRGHWWAPSGDRLLVARVDSTAVERWHIADPSDPGARPRVVPYAAAGGVNPEVRMWVVALDGTRSEIRWDHRRFEYLVGAGWDAHGPYAVVQSRDQRRVLFLAIDPGSGATTVVTEQHDDAWVQLVPGLPARTGSAALVTHVDLDGTRHLCVGGAIVTPSCLQLRAVLAVEGEEVLFAASDEPTETHLWSWSADGGVRRLSVEPGVHSGVRRDGTLVQVARTDLPGGRVTVRRNESVATIESFVERPVLAAQPTRLALGPRQLRAALYLPSWHRQADGQLPVLLDPYGGAGRQQVTRESDWRSLVSQWFAEQGFAVLAADGAGTPGRGPDFEREVHGDLYGPVLADQVTALHETARLHPVLDLERVGIRGWSFGGSLAAWAVLCRPEVFHVAVAGAGVTDQRLYDGHWRERFLGHPNDFPQRYEDNSLLRLAPALRRPLLLIHGLADDNVFPANTLRLSSALLAAGRPHDVLLLPGVGHGAIGAAGTEDLLWHQVTFLQRHLGVAPREVPG